MKCTKCKGGLVSVAGGYARCSCQRDKIATKLYIEAGFKEEHYVKREDVKNQPVFSARKVKTTYKELLENLVGDPYKVRKMIEKEMTIVLRGNPGSGKTQFATTATYEILKQFNLYVPVIHTYKAFFLDVRTISNWMSKQEEKEAILKKVREASVLVIDDLGTEQNTNTHIITAFDELLRSFRGIKFITTNLNENLKKKYDAIDTRLSDVLIPADESDHGRLNVLYYEITTPKGVSRRQRQVDDLDFI